MPPAIADSKHCMPVHSRCQQEPGTVLTLRTRCLRRISWPQSENLERNEQSYCHRYLFSILSFSLLTTSISLLNCKIPVILKRSFLALMYNGSIGEKSSGLFLRSSAITNCAQVSAGYKTSAAANAIWKVWHSPIPNMHDAGNETKRSLRPRIMYGAGRSY